MSKKTFLGIKKIINITWISLVLVGLLYAAYKPSAFSVENVAAFIQKFDHWIWLIYILISLFRGILLFPSAPFILVGAILFPTKLFWVWLVSISGILFAATSLYYFAEQIGFGDYLQKKYASQIQKAQESLNKPSGKWLVAAWAWFPFLPTNIICYVAGLVKMRFRFMITGIFLGESILVALYLYLGKDILSYIF